MINRSEEIAELAAALSEAQNEMGSALKDADAHHGKYADLASVIKAIKQPLAKQGLSYAQLPIRESESAGVTTLLMHKAVSSSSRLTRCHWLSLTRNQWDLVSRMHVDMRCKRSQASRLMMTMVQPLLMRHLIVYLSTIRR